LNELVEPSIRGDPEAALRWVSLSQRHPSAALAKRGFISGKRAMLSLTIGGPPGTYRKDGRNGDINAILRPIQRGMLEFVGFSVLAPALFHGPVRVDDAQRHQWLENYSARLRQIGEEAPIQVGRY
jgi:NAD(P)H dehydrogenase (quinone)